MFLHLSVILFTGGCLLRYTPLVRHGGVSARGVSASVHAGIHIHPPAVTAADGMHPTGMHSCSQKYSRKAFNFGFDCALKKLWK